MDFKAKGRPVVNICCLGVDNIGVPASCVLAHMCPALKVAVTDLSPEKVMLWNTKQLPTFEPGLEEIIKKCVNKNLVFTTDTVGAIKAADLIFLSLDSPISLETGGDKGPNMTEIDKAARLIAKTATSSKIVVEKTTVPVGCGAVLSRILKANRNATCRFQVLSNPEFFPLGEAVENLMEPSRVLIGSDETPEGIAAAEVLVSIYCHWVPREKIITMNVWSTELSKLGTNAFLAQRLSSVNAMSMLCEATGGDISTLVKIMGMSSDIGSEYLSASLGFGGDHLKKDLLCLIYMLEKANLPQVADYWKEVININEIQKNQFKKKILSAFFNTMNHKKVAIWGFSYKKKVPMTTDSPAAFICKSLLEEGAKLCIYDPEVEKRQIIDELKESLGIEKVEKNIVFSEDPYKAAYKANAIISCTDWEEFKSLDFATIYKDMLRPAYIFDGRKFLPHESLIAQGFIVKTIGKQFDGV